MRILGPVLVLALTFAASACSHATAAGLLAPGRPAPDLVLRDQTNAERRLSDFRGHPVVVYFYPKDGTPGCTREACAFRDAWTHYEQAGVQIVGVSTNDVASHAEFAREHQLPFPLLSDPEAKLARAFGVAQHFGMDSRVSFLLDSEGVVRRVFENVDPGVHADEVLGAVHDLGLH